MKYAYHLSKVQQHYNGEVVLQLDDYSIESNKVTALVGPNGSGKSTLLDLLAFISRPGHGSIKFYDQIIQGQDCESQRQLIGYVQQRPYLFNMSVDKNIGIGLKLRGLTAEAINSRVDSIISEFKLDELRSRRGHELSGGEIQKVALARAMILEPKVLLLDEPFSHLDRNSRLTLEELIRGLSVEKKQTIIFSTHDQFQAQSLADNISTLVKGNIMPTLLLNVFNGSVNSEESTFDTGQIKIHIPGNFMHGNRLVIDSSHLVLSHEPIVSSMRNSFHGSIQGLSKHTGNIYVTVNVGEKFHAIITSDAWKALNINIGDEVWLSFKSTAVTIF